MRDPRKNPFLVLGVSNDAEMSVIQSVGKRRLMALRLDDDADPAAEKRIEAALETLADPVERFEWGLLAPELTAKEAEAFRNDPALSTLADNPLQDGMAAYQRICEADSPAILAHNQGGLKLVQAVAATEEAQKGTPDDIRDDLECVALWKVAYRNLRLAFGSDKFWMRQRLRAKGLEDQRLDGNRVKRIQADIFKEMVQPVGTVIREALLSRHVEVAKAYVDLIRSSGFEEHFVDEVLSSVYKPLADRVERIVADLGARLGEAGDDAREYASILRAFKRKAEPDLKVMIDVGDLPGYAEEHARDTSAAFLRRLSISAWNHSEAIDTSKSAIRLAERIVDSEADRRKYQKDIRIFLDIEARKTRTKEIHPLRSKLNSAIERDDIASAIATIDEMVRRGADDDGELAALRQRLSTKLATQLFTKGMKAFERGDFVAARQWMDKALVVETVPSERILIYQALAKIRAATVRAVPKTTTRPTSPPTNRPPSTATGTTSGARRPGASTAKAGEPRSCDNGGEVSLATPRGRKRLAWPLAFCGLALIVLLGGVLGRQSRRTAYTTAISEASTRFSEDIQSGAYEGIVLPEYEPERAGTWAKTSARVDVDRCNELVASHNSRILDAGIRSRFVPPVISTHSSELEEIFSREIASAGNPKLAAKNLTNSLAVRFRNAGIVESELSFLHGLMIEMARANNGESEHSIEFMVEAISSELARLEILLYEKEKTVVSSNSTK